MRKIAVALVAMLVLPAVSCMQRKGAEPAPELVERLPSPAPSPPARVALAQGVAASAEGVSYGTASFVPAMVEPDVAHNTEEYGRFDENPFLRPGDEPLSTFSIDVDRASYANVRRFVRNGQKPPRDAVRIEEMVNYFTYDYPDPESDPFSITTEVARCPWNEKHKLMLIGLQGKRMKTEDLPPNNLVFLIDSSGSMRTADKLPLVKAGLELLVEQLRPQDRVAIVTYAGSAGLVLPSTPGSKRGTILEAIHGLEARGSTAGAEGIVLAYEVAKENFLERGNNRVILATDGDFNVGVSSDGELEQLIEQKRRDRIFLTVLGFGTGNIKDSKMELLADKGNGNYAYIDSLHEARKTLVHEMGATLFTIAKDVKIQVEFNPSVVGAYRLIGYENRVMRSQDFNDDAKDAGELGAGHSVTALYEIVPPGESIPGGSVDPLKYQSVSAKSGGAELATVKLRYKEPDGDTSRLLTRVVGAEANRFLSDNLQLASAVAQLGMLLRDSPHKGAASFDDVISRGKLQPELVALARDAKRVIQ
jgi:Ca-activated chloride channel homolog